MKKLFILTVFILSTISLYSQRDIVVIDSTNNEMSLLPSNRPHKITYICRDTGYVTPNFNDLQWSYNMGDYIFYSRIEMGRRMNNSIHYNKLSQKYFVYGSTSLALSTTFYIAAAYNNPVSYIESHYKYTRSYFNKSKTNRNIKVSCGVLFTGLSIYYFYKSNKYSQKSRWMISPDGIRYKF